MKPFFLWMVLMLALVKPLAADPGLVDERTNWQAQGYVKKNGRWVSPAEAVRYLDAVGTAKKLKPILVTEGVTNNLEADIDEMGRQTGPEAIDDKRRSLLELQKYGHESYQPAITELLAACASAIQLRQGLAQITPDVENASDRYHDALGELRGYPAKNAQQSAELEALRQRALRAMAFIQNVEKFREEARRHCQAGAILARQVETKK